MHGYSSHDDEKIGFFWRDLNVIIVLRQGLNVLLMSLVPGGSGTKGKLSSLG